MLRLTSHFVRRRCRFIQIRMIFRIALCSEITDLFESGAYLREVEKEKVIPITSFINAADV